MGTRASISIDNILRVTDDIATKLGGVNGEVVEVRDRLPARIDPDIIIGQVMVWKDIQSRLGENVYLRVFAESYRPDVEKYVLNLVKDMEYILVTIVPL